MSISLVQQNCHHGGLSLLLSSVPYLQLTVCQGWLAMIKMLIMEGNRVQKSQLVTLFTRSYNYAIVSLS